MNWYHIDPARRRITLTLHIQPNARASGIAGRFGDALKIRIHAPAVDDKANAELIDLLHRWFKLPVGDIKITHGGRGRRKRVELSGAGSAHLDIIASIDAACPTSSNSE